MSPKLEKLIRSPYFDRYLQYLTSDDLAFVLNQSKNDLIQILEQLETSKFDFRYEPGKWTIKEVVHHIIETELIFNYRALRIARDTDFQVLNGFDENHYASESFLTNLSAEELIHYFKAVRQSTQYLFMTLNEQQLNKVGRASGFEIQAEALFYITAGHTMHHIKVLKEKYLVD